MSPPSSPFPAPTKTRSLPALLTMPSSPSSSSTPNLGPLLLPQETGASCCSNPTLSAASASASPPSERITINDLPEDILVLILAELTIWDIFAIRLTSRTLNAVLSSSVRSVSRRVCLNTFPGDRMLAKKPANGSGEWDFEWLRDRVPRKLAAVLLDHGERPIPAESEWGEVARYRVARGWKVLKQLSTQYREVYGLSDDAVLGLGVRGGGSCGSLGEMGTEKGVTGKKKKKEEEEEEKEKDDKMMMMRMMKGQGGSSSGRRRKPKPVRWKGQVKDVFRKDLTVLEMREELALARCRQVVGALRKCDALGFMLLWDRLVCGPFRAYFGPYDELHEDCIGRRMCLCPAYCGSLAAGVDAKGGDNVITLERGNCWMTWFILRHGPGMFFRQWCSQEATFIIGHEVDKTWKTRSKREIEIERNVGARIWANVWMRAWSHRSRKHAAALCGAGAGKAMEIFNPSRILRPEYLWWDDSINQGGLGSSAMPWMSFIFEEQPMWQELYDDYGSLPIRGQVLWLLWQEGKIGLDEDFDVEEMLATTEDVDELLDSFWTISILQPGFGVVNYGIGSFRRGRKRRRSLGVGKLLFKAWRKIYLSKLRIRRP